MTQDERWIIRYEEVMEFVTTNKRRPSKYTPEERNCWNWWRHTQKQLNAGQLKEDRIPLFQKLVELGEKYRRKNQYE